MSTSYDSKVQRVKKASPAGFTNLLETITRIVLQHRPLNIYKFLYQYLDAELDKRTLKDLSSGE